MCGAFAILETGPDGRGVVRIVEERNGRTFTEARHSRSAGSHWLDRWEDHGDPIHALSGALAICALADFFLFPGLPVGERLMGMVCVSVPMYTLCMVVKEAFGGGDILLLSIMGFYLGWRALLPGVFLGFLLGGLEAVWLLASGRAKPGEGAHMAFGPALCLGLGISLFYGERIFFWYAGLFG